MPDPDLYLLSEASVELIRQALTSVMHTDYQEKGISKNTRAYLNALAEVDKPYSPPLTIDKPSTDLDTWRF